MPPPADSFHPRDRAAWRAWLAANHERTAGIWLIRWRKESGRTDLSYEDAVEEALCFGWIDSRGGKLDAARTMLWMAPRRRGSGWSAPNKRRIERLLELGLMAPAGLARIEAARADGSWEKLDAVERLEVPADLAEVLRGLPGATANFAAFPRSVRRGILAWIAAAKRPETRARRVRETAERAARNERANQWRKA